MPRTNQRRPSRRRALRRRDRGGSEPIAQRSPCLRWGEVSSELPVCSVATMVALPCLLCVLLLWTRIEENSGKCPLKRTAPRLPSVSSAELLSRGPLSEPEGFFVQEARRSGVCVTKMAQGRRPAFCCLSEECLLSGAGGGGDRRGAGIEKSGAFEGAEGQSLGTGAGKIFPPPRFIPADKDRPSPGRKSPPSWEHHPSGCCLLFYYFLPRSCGRAPSWTSVLLGCVAFLLPSPCLLSLAAAGSACC